MLDSMMMKNVRSAAVNADCVLILVDACKVPENVWFYVHRIVFVFFFFPLIYFLTVSYLQIDEVLKEGVGYLEDKPPTLLILNKKDLIKPGEIAKKLEVGTH